MKISGNEFYYSDFVSWMQVLVKNKLNSGEKQTSTLAGFTELNLTRMERLNKTIVLKEIFEELFSSIYLENQKWVLITESWCGDSAQNLPAIAKIAEASQGKIELTIILRDENPEWMEKYTTNGSKSIPKLISFDKNGKELFTWGPRPKFAQDFALAWKKFPESKTWAEFEVELHTWYSKDKTQTLQQEFYELLQQTIKNNINSKLLFSDN